MPKVVLNHSVLFDSAIQLTVAPQAPLSMGILQAGILEWVAVLSSRGSSQASNPTLPHCRQILYHLSHKGSLVPMVRYSLCELHLTFEITV